MVTTSLRQIYWRSFINGLIIDFIMKKSVNSLFILLFLILLSVSVYAQNGYNKSNINVASGEKISKVPNNYSNGSLQPSFALQAIAINITDDDAVLGNPNAPVTMIEFGGFWEPFSYDFYIDTFPTIKSQYIDTGKVKYVFRDFPLEELNPLDPLAAQGAECVGKQGGDSAYFAMYNSLFSSLEEPSYELFNQLASNLGYDIHSCLDSREMAEEVTKDYNDAISLGVEGSPTFFINEEVVSGAYPYETFRIIIEQELNESIVCFKNSDCNDNNTYTFDKCDNSGKLNAVCTHQPIRCVKNSDCGNASTKKSCSNDNLCTNTTTFSCLNPGTVQSSCKTTANQTCISCTFGCNNQTLLCKPAPVITVYSPLSTNYNITKIPFNLTIGNNTFSEVSYIDWNQIKPKFISLCKNCKEYGLNKAVTKSLKNGLHNLTFMAVNESIVITKNITFLIDSESPKISSTFPKSKSFTNGSNFYVEYTEDNCKSLGVIVNNIPVSGINSSCSSGKNIERFVNLNLNSYNNQEIEYQFIIKDKSNNSAESKKTKVKVDTTKPVINSFVNITNGKKVTFTLNITELNFEEVSYIDYSDSKPKEKTLCSKLKDGICNSSKTLKTGNHDITISVLDKAGNMIQRNTKFVI